MADIHCALRQTTQQNRSLIQPGGAAVRERAKMLTLQGEKAELHEGKTHKDAAFDTTLSIIST